MCFVTPLCCCFCLCLKTLRHPPVYICVRHPNGKHSRAGSWPRRRILSNQQTFELEFDGSSLWTYVLLVVYISLSRWFSLALSMGNAVICNARWWMNELRLRLLSPQHEIENIVESDQITRDETCSSIWDDIYIFDCWLRTTKRDSANECIDVRCTNDGPTSPYYTNSNGRQSLFKIKFSIILHNIEFRVAVLPRTQPHPSIIRRNCRHIWMLNGQIDVVWRFASIPFHSLTTFELIEQMLSNWWKILNEQIIHDQEQNEIIV